MKKLLIILLTICILGFLVLFGISLSSKSIIIETTEVFMREEITKRIVETTSENSNLNREEIKQKINDVMEENPKIKEFISSSFDKILDVINDKVDNNSIDFFSDVDSLIEETRPILLEYDIVITDEMKEEVMSFVKSDEANNLITQTVEEIKTSIPEEVKTMVKGFSLLLSFNFRMILISLIIVLLIIIAFLKKSYYKWIINLASPCVITGFLFIILVTLFKKLIEGKEVTLNVTSMNNYGLVNLILGILLIIIFIILTKVFNNKTNEIEEKI